MSRKLASLQVIKDIQPIPDADFIEVATVQGWQVVVQKGLHKVDDMVVFFEIDSLLPDNQPWCVFMKERKYRVKTIKLRKQISQGLIIPMDECLHNSYLEPQLEGDDVTEQLGVIKPD